MRSAYLVLGIPGNATPDDVETAYRSATQVYSPERIASEPGAVDKFNEIKDAYKILRDPQARAAHDRKLSAVPRPRGNICCWTVLRIRLATPSRVSVLLAPVPASVSWSARCPGSCRPCKRSRRVSTPDNSASRGCCAFIAGNRRTCAGNG